MGWRDDSRARKKPGDRNRSRRGGIVFCGAWLRGVHHLFERGLVDDVVVQEGCLDQAFGNVEVVSRGMDVVLAGFVGLDVRLKVGEWAEEPLGESPLELLAFRLCSR